MAMVVTSVDPSQRSRRRRVLGLRWNTERMRSLIVGLCTLVLLASACRTARDEPVEAQPLPSSAPTAPSSSTTTASAAADESEKAEASETSSIDVGTDDDAEEDASSGCDSVTTGTDSFTMTGGGAEHDVQVYVPTDFDPSSPLPLVLNWHGLGGDGRGQARFSGYEALAESEGFIVVHPTGVPASGDTRNSWELPQFDSPARDDVAFANELLDEMVVSYCIDESRVYSTGMSNGGFFTSVLVCEMADRLAAAASVAGLTHADDCSPSRAVPFIAFHGTADAVVPFDGTQSNSVLGGGGFFEQVMPDEFAEFAADMGCAVEPTVSPYAREVTAYSYEDCDQDVPLVFYEIADGGHTWPSTPLAARSASLGYTTTEIDATADAWAFFEQHRLEG